MKSFIFRGLLILLALVLTVGLIYNLSCAQTVTPMFGVVSMPTAGAGLMAGNAWGGTGGGAGLMWGGGNLM